MPSLPGTQRDDRADERADESPGPYAALAAKARAASDGALATCVGVGVLWLALLLVIRPAWWSFVTAPLALGAFGLWGIAERERAVATTARARLFHAAQLLAIVVGTLAVLLSALRILGALVGTVIS